ncbi:unnamed protein product [Ixodes pacificus]
MLQKVFFGAHRILSRSYIVTLPLLWWPGNLSAIQNCPCSFLLFSVAWHDAEP